MNRWDGRAAALEHNVGEHTAPEIQEVCVCFFSHMLQSGTR